MPPMPSTLYIALPMETLPQDAYSVGTFEDGALLLHGAPGSTAPADALLIVRDGSTPWTWDEIADELPELLPVATPHEWAGEITASPTAVERFSAAKPAPLDAPEVSA